jgi:prepilin-type N-terminal cleavage/methylation domain-containing protein
MKLACNNKQQGFTLIEVLVASTIVIMSIGTILQLFSVGLDQNQRVAQLAHLLTAQRTVIARIEQINPAHQQKGQGAAAALSYQWEAKILQPYKKMYEEESFFPRELALFNINVQIEKPRGGVYQFDLQQIGWRSKK